MATSIQTCYRHGDRRAGVVCQRCDRPICPDCMRQASVGFHCPDCTRAASQVSRAAVKRVRRVQRPYVTIALVVVNAAVFLLDRVWTAVVLLPGIGPTKGGVLFWEGLLYGPNVAAGDWWRPITSGFIHAQEPFFGLVHVGVNMFLVYMLGRLLEPALGQVRFLILYMMSLLGGSTLVLLLSPGHRTVGASGAVFGLMGAVFVALRARGVDPFSTGIGPLLVINVIFTFAAPGVSIGGHLGGLAAGAFGGWLLSAVAPRIPNGPVVTGLIGAGLTLVLFAACLVIPAPEGYLLPPLI